MQDDIFRTIEEKYKVWKQLQFDSLDYYNQMVDGLYEAYEKMQPDFPKEYVRGNLNISVGDTDSYDYKMMIEQQNKADEWRQFVLNASILKDVKDNYVRCERELSSIETEIRTLSKPYVEKFSPLLAGETEYVDEEVDIDDIMDVFSVLKKLEKK